MAQLGFHINSSVCTGCKACELACKDKHSFDIGPRARRVHEVCGGSWKEDVAGVYRPEGVYSYSVSYSCGHCDMPACVAACPTGAHQKDEETGVVWIDADECIGCGSCAAACPYDAPQLVETDKIMRKCDMCKDLMEHGEVAACVAICPQRALEVAPIDELRQNYGEAQDVQPLPDSSETKPNIVITAHRDARFAGDETPTPLTLGQ